LDADVSSEKAPAAAQAFGKPEIQVILGKPAFGPRTTPWTHPAPGKPVAKL
jgi:hypothetical protein